MFTMSKRVVILLVCLVLAAAAVARADRSERVPLRSSFNAFPYAVGDFAGFAEPPFTPRELEVLGLDDYLTRSYVDPATRVGIGLYIGYWQSQKQGSTIHSPQNCLPGAGWEPVAQGTLSFPDPRVAGAPDLQANRYIVQKGDERMLVVYWFQSHGRIVASEYWSKFYLVADAMRLNRSDGAIVRLTLPITGPGADAERRADDEARAFAKVLVPKLEEFLPN